jgi:hypothetical protein
MVFASCACCIFVPITQDSWWLQRWLQPVLFSWVLLLTSACVRQLAHV